MKFEKVSPSSYLKSMIKYFYDKDFIDVSNQEAVFVRQEYEDIKLPKRATKNSAGYDFFSPFSFILKTNQTITIPTGIKCQLDEDKFLMIAPRSSLGFKYKVRLDNTLGIIDADFYNNESDEGHIMIKITNENVEGKEMKIKKGEAVAQGIILSYYKVEDDAVTTDRIGGIGSTNG